MLLNISQRNRDLIAERMTASQYRKDTRFSTRMDEDTLVSIL